MTVTKIQDKETFKQIVSTPNRLIVIDASASWCGPCKRIAPMYEKLAENMPNIIFCKVDIDEFDKFSKKFNVKTVPTFIFIKNGQLVTSVQGANYNAIVEACNTHL